MGRLRRKGRRPAVGAVLGEKGRGEPCGELGLCGRGRSLPGERDLAPTGQCWCSVLSFPWMGPGEPSLPFFGWHQPFQPPHLSLPFSYITPSQKFPTTFNLAPGSLGWGDRGRLHSQPCLLAEAPSSCGLLPFPRAFAGLLGAVTTHTL